MGLCYCVTEGLWGRMSLVAVCSLYSCIQSPCVQMYSLTLVQTYCILAWVMSQASPNMIPVTDDKGLSNSVYRGFALIILNTTRQQIMEFNTSAGNRIREPEPVHFLLLHTFCILLNAFVSFAYFCKILHCHAHFCLLFILFQAFAYSFAFSVYSLLIFAYVLHTFNLI